MAQKSTYLQAPFTQSDLVQTVKDGFAIVGADTVQTTDNSYVYDSDYWITKYRKTSAVNLVNESEVLLYPQVDKTTNDTNNQSSFFGTKVQSGANIYVIPNSNSAYPFALSNYIKPREYAVDSYLVRRLPTLDTSKQYTYSFYARKPDSGTVNKLPVSIRQVGTNTYTTNLHTVTNSWQRFTGTFTPSSTSMELVFGSYNRWNPSTNYITYSEYFQAWAVQSGTNGDYYNYPSPFGYQKYYQASKFTNTSSSTTSYIYISAGIGAPITGKTYTFSIYAKLLSGAPKLVVSDNGPDNSLTNGVVTVIDTVDTWKRYSLTYTFNGTTTSQTINAHIAMLNGDSVILWGASLVEGTQPLPYIPTQSEQFLSSTTNFTGDLEIAGLQLEQAAAATAYSPVTNWVYNQYDTPIDVNTTLNGETLGITCFIPGGIVSQAFNVVDNDNSFYNGAIGNHHSGYLSHSSTSSKNSFTFDTGGLIQGWVAHPEVGDSNYGMYSALPSNRMPHAPDALSQPTRTFFTTSAGSILGTRLVSFAQTTYLPTTPVKLNFTIKGTLFKISDSAVDFGLPAGKIRSIVVNIKTPGNGKRKQINYTFIDNNSANTTNLLYIPNLNHQTSIGNAEAVQPLKASLLPKRPYNPGDGRSYQIGTYAPDVVGTLFNHFIDYTSLSRASDVFNFMQGSSEGFVHLLNVNSNFVFYAGAFDSVNQPIAADDGTLSSRTFIMTNRNSSYDFWFLNNGPMFANYSPHVGVYFSSMWSSYFSGTSSGINPSLEVYGDAVSTSKQLFPVYLGSNSIYGTSNRGQMKNLYMSSDTAFTGSVGDLYIAKDNSKYFCFAKKLISSSNGSSFGTVCMFVKV